jgi:hypothetical protein
MKSYFFLLLIVVATSCQVTETIHINPDGSGTIEAEELRHESSYMQLAGENYSKEEIFRDTTYAFKDFIAKYPQNFSKYTVPEQTLFRQYENVKVHIKKSSYEKEFRTSMALNFNKIEHVPDLYKTEDYADDIENNYALAAEEHNYIVSYTFEGGIFKRIVKITNAERLKKKIDEIAGYKEKLAKFKLVQTLTFKYHFPRKIKSVSNPNAKISEDKMSLSLEFNLSDCIQNPESTNLEVVLEQVG